MWMEPRRRAAVSPRHGIRRAPGHVRVVPFLDAMVSTSGDAVQLAITVSPRRNGDPCATDLPRHAATPTSSCPRHATDNHRGCNIGMLSTSPCHLCTTVRMPRCRPSPSPSTTVTTILLHALASPYRNIGIPPKPRHHFSPRRVQDRTLPSQPSYAASPSPCLLQSGEFPTKAPDSPYLRRRTCLIQALAVIFHCRSAAVSFTSTSACPTSLGQDGHRCANCVLIA